MTPWYVPVPVPFTVTSGVPVLVPVRTRSNVSWPCVPEAEPREAMLAVVSGL